MILNRIDHSEQHCKMQRENGHLQKIDTVRFFFITNNQSTREVWTVNRHSVSFSLANALGNGEITSRDREKIENTVSSGQAASSHDDGSLVHSGPFSVVARFSAFKLATFPSSYSFSL